MTMLKRNLICMIAIFILSITFVSYNNYRVKQADDVKEDLVSIIKNTDFIERENGKYKINKDKLTSENLALKNKGKLPRENKVCDMFKISQRIAFNRIDSLGQKTLDEQVYVMGNFYINSSDKEKANKYIDILERNLNENLDGFIKKDNEISKQIKEGNANFILDYVVIVISGLCVIILGFKIVYDLLALS